MKTDRTIWFELHGQNSELTNHKSLLIGRKGQII